MSSAGNGRGARGPTAAGDEIAIVGMSCLFPGAPDLETYWKNIVSKVDAVTDPPPEAWSPATFYDPETRANDRVYCKRGGYIGPLAHFDAVGNGVMPIAVEGGEPDQWLALRVAREAFADAGYGDEVPERARTAVILGKGTYINRGNLNAVQHGRMVDQTLDILKKLHPEYTEEEIGAIRRDLKSQLPPFNADTAPGLIPNIIAGRIANRLDLMGPNYTIDAACASSLVAVEHAVRGLSSGDYDLALVGGVHVATPVPTLMLFCQLGALSRREQIRPFDRSADGTILGTGIGMMVLKRRSDAERAGDRIYAVVKGVGVSSDGRGLGVMAPRLEGEVLALQRAYEAAGVSPRSVGLIEAHGTGTPVGDATEVRALTEVFGRRDGALPWCGLGSVKSMIGHTMPAAGMAGLIKAALSLHHKILPPTLHVEEPHPELELNESPFFINTETRPWISGRDTPRRAGVNAFGFGGINSHVVLEEPAAPSAVVSVSAFAPKEWDTELCILSAGSRSDLCLRARALRDFLRARPDTSLEDLAYTLNVPLQKDARRLAIVCHSIPDLDAKLGRALERLDDPGCRRIQEVAGIYYFEEPLAESGGLVFLFPGEGSQYVNMLSDLCLHFPEVRESFDAIDRIFANHSRNYVPSDFIFPRPTFSDAERALGEQRMWQMEGAFEAVLTASWALYALLDRLEIRPDAVLGHSTGEYAALRASGMLELTDDERIAEFATELNGVYYRQKESQGEIAPAVLVAVGSDAESVAAVTRALPGRFHLAMDNCPHQTVVVAREEDFPALADSLQRRGMLYEKLPFDRPYHTPLFESYSDELGTFFSRWLVSPPRVPTYSCTSASTFPEDLAAARDLAVRHWVRPVAFRETIETMYADGLRVFVEVGPRGNLSAFVDDILRGRRHLAVPANVVHRSGVSQLNHLVGVLAAQGTAMRLEPLYERRRPRRLDLEGGASPDADEGRKRPMKLATGWIPLELSEETASKLRSRTRPAEERSAPARAPNGSPPRPVEATASGSSVEPMFAYWETMEQFLAVQEDVMTAFLTRAPAPTRDAEAPRTSPSEVRSAPIPTVESREHPPSGNGRLQTRELELVPRPAAPRGEEAAGSVTAAPEATAAPTSSVELRETLLRIIGERTGYPSEMIDLDLDLEADLGIDSIKRVEILGSFQHETEMLKEQDMEALSTRKTLRAILAFLESSEPAPEREPAREVGDAAPPPGATRPFIGSVDSWTEGKEVVVTREIRLDEDRFLRDHALGGQVSIDDPELTALPIVPLTMSMEMMAEAAAMLAPGRRLVGMRDVRAHRWIALEDDRLTLKIVARTGADAAAGIAVRVFESRPPEAAAAGEAPILEGTMDFGEARAEPPAASALSLAGERPSRWATERLYEDVMFHGPLFRGVASMDRWGRDGAEATLKVLPADGLFRSSPDPDLLTDPVLLDQPGQVVGFWTAEHLEEGFVVFPFYLESLELFGPGAESGDRLTCQARIELVGRDRVRSELDVVSDEGRVSTRFHGWEDRRFDLPRELLRFLHAPESVTLSEPAPLDVAGAPPAGFVPVEAYRLELDRFPRGFFTAHGSLWQRALAHVVLGRRERATWRASTASPRERLTWLLARVVAKDAVRSHLKKRFGLARCPADIEVLADGDERLVVAGAWTDAVPSIPRVSVSVDERAAVAFVGEGPATEKEPPAPSPREQGVRSDS